jgi:hypothetical protein
MSGQGAMRVVSRVMLAGALMACGSLQAAEKGKVLMVMRQSAPGETADPEIVAHLRKSGYQVTTSEGVGELPDVCRYDVVLLSSTVRSNQFTAERGFISTLRNMRVPLVTWENDLLDDLRYTGLQRDADFGELETGHYGWMVRAPHPLSAGIPAGLTTWTEARQPAGWGKPGLGADIIMVWPGEPDKSTLFAYERGATMNHDFLAPARRVFIGMDNATFSRMTDNGHRLFDAAVAWALQDGPQARRGSDGGTCISSSPHSALD